MNQLLDFLINRHGTLQAEHLEDLRKSGLNDPTIQAQRITTVPPADISTLLHQPVPRVDSAYLIPFADPAGGFMDFPRLRIFPMLDTKRGTIKYLQPPKSGVRLFFPVIALDTVFKSDRVLWCCEGEKKALAAAQLGLAAIGIAGCEGWHQARERTLHPDFATIPLAGRTVEVCPDGDVNSNRAVARAMSRLLDALAARGARPRLVLLPEAE